MSFCGLMSSLRVLVGLMWTKLVILYSILVFLISGGFTESFVFCHGPS